MSDEIQGSYPFCSALWKSTVFGLLPLALSSLYKPERHYIIPGFAFTCLLFTHLWTEKLDALNKLKAPFEALQTKIIWKNGVAYISATNNERNSAAHNSVINDDQTYTNRHNSSARDNESHVLS